MARITRRTKIGFCDVALGHGVPESFTAKLLGFQVQAAPVSASSSSSNVGGTGRFPAGVTSNTLPMSSSWPRTEACIEVSRSTSISAKM